MARRKQNYPLIEGLEITTLAAEGKAMGRWQDQVVFVPMTVPGDLVDVQIRNRRRRFMEGTVVRYVHRSPLRVEPFCAHFGVCGGCKWQNLPYAEQLRFKTEQVRDQLARIGKILVQTHQVIEGRRDLALDEGGIAGATRGNIGCHLAHAVEGVRADELALTVEVRGDDYVIGLFCKVFEHADNLLLRGLFDNGRPREIR